jgi:TorA maturation chaperone TorD
MHSHRQMGTCIADFPGKDSAVSQTAPPEAGPLAHQRRPVTAPDVSPVGPVTTKAEAPVEDQARADCYSLAAALLLSPPDRALLERIAEAAHPARDPAAVILEPSEPIGGNPGKDPLEASWLRLSSAASVMPADAIAAEYAALFEGIGKPLLDPYGSPYLSGFMMEKPLAALRADLAALGIARASHATVPEDHLGALCETMRLLVAGAPGYPSRPLAEQHAFFARHLEPWAFDCLDDIEQAQPANFYRCVANFIRQLLDAERRAFALDLTH